MCEPHSHFFYLAVFVTVFNAMAANRWAPPLETPLIWILSIAVVVQIFLSIRQIYRQGWLTTTSKFLFGGFVIVLISALAITAIATVALP